MRALGAVACLLVAILLLITLPAILSRTVNMSGAAKILSASTTGKIVHIKDVQTWPVNMDSNMKGRHIVERRLPAFAVCLFCSLSAGTAKHQAEPSQKTEHANSHCILQASRNLSWLLETAPLGGVALDLLG